MAKASALGASAPDSNAINLARLLARLQKTLLHPDITTEQRLRSSGYERRKVGTNLEYARTLLLHLEQDCTDIKVQTKKQEIQTDLLQKRDVIQRLNERLQELEAIKYDTEGDSSEGEDLLGEDTPSDDVDDDGTPPETLSGSASDFRMEAGSAFEVDLAAAVDSSREELFPSSLRARQTHHQGPDTATATSSAFAAASGANTAVSAPAITSTTEMLLTHNRTEQESLTTSLLTMAQALKTSSLAFSSSLESETEIMARATEGLDRNKEGLDAAQKRMGYLRTLTEGKGWWGRVLMYVWIFALMFFALFIVAFLPKLRF